MTRPSIPTELKRKIFVEADHRLQQTKFHSKYRIKTTRLQNYDYSWDGAYFITICTKNREHFFGEIIDGLLQETESAKICRACWSDLPNHYPNCILDLFVIMPNHVHGIIFIKNFRIETGLKPVSTEPKQYSISEIIRGFKTFTARKINDFQNTQGISFWQSRFYDHIIRNDDALDRIRQYILDNHANWEKDRNNLIIISKMIQLECYNDTIKGAYNEKYFNEKT